MIETSLTKFGMILDSIQGDVMQVNKGMKEFLMESKFHNSSVPEIENICYCFLL